MEIYATTLNLLEYNIKTSYHEKIAPFSSCIHSTAKYLLNTGYILSSRKTVTSCMAMVPAFMELVALLERQSLDKYIHR